MELDDGIAGRIPLFISTLFQETSDAGFRKKVAEVLCGLADAGRYSVTAKAHPKKGREASRKCVVWIDGLRRKRLFIELERSADKTAPFSEKERAALQFAGELISDELKRRKMKPVSREKLSLREAEIAKLVQEGLSNREIGSRLGISAGTVKRHLYNMFNKTGVNSRTALVRYLLTRESGG